MDKEDAWSIFETTGQIDAYLLYRDLSIQDDESFGREDSFDADQNRRPGYPGYERR